MPVLRRISLQAIQSELWNRTPSDKKASVRIQSMLPQIEVPAATLRHLMHETSGVLPASKLSASHYVTVRAHGHVFPSSECPSSDYAMRVALEPEDASSVLRSVGQRVARLNKAEPLDLCRTNVIRASSRELLFDLVFPWVNLSYTPLAALKIVSTPLSIQLTSTSTPAFDSGFVTMDKCGRVLPLLMTDPLALRYPVVGIWVANIPEPVNFTGKYTEIVHPLVWAACVQFIENPLLKDKISPLPATNAFLLVHFSSRPKFYEVSCEQAYWTRTSVRVTNFQQPAVVNFLRQPAPTKPPVRPSSEHRRRSCSPSAERIITEQGAMLAKLQAQLLELRKHVFNSPTAPEPAKEFESEVKPRRQSGGERASSCNPPQALLRLGDRPPLFKASIRTVSSSQETTDSGYARQEPRSQSESTFVIPRIEYESSLDEDCL